MSRPGEGSLGCHGHDGPLSRVQGPDVGHVSVRETATSETASLATAKLFRLKMAENATRLRRAAKESCIVGRIKLRVLWDFRD